MRFINLTPHEINIYNESKELITTLYPSGQVARIEVSRVKTGNINGIPLFVSIAGDYEELPEPKDGIAYVVSGILRSHVQRHDLWQPGELLRDDTGQPIGCIGLSQ